MGGRINGFDGTDGSGGKEGIGMLLTEGTGGRVGIEIVGSACLIRKLREEVRKAKTVRNIFTIYYSVPGN
jgi:hypothetical protein